MRIPSALIPSVVLVVCAFASVAQAWPVDLAVVVPEGGEIFRKLSAIDGVEIEDAAIARAEVLPTGELMISGVAEGKTLLLLHAQGRMAVWRVEVLPSGRAQRPRAAKVLPKDVKDACPGAKISDDRLVTSVTSAACRLALLEWLQSDVLLAGELDVTFSLEALQAQLAAIEQALKDQKLPLSARYLGAGLVLEGSLKNEKERRAALWLAFRHSVGRVPLDDRMKVPVRDAGE